MKISQLQMLIFSLFYQQHQLSCAVTFIAMHVTIQQFLAVCKTISITLVAQRSDGKVSEGNLVTPKRITSHSMNVPRQGV
jgi:hypothetical protein